MPFQPVVIDSSITRIGGGSVYVHEGYYLMKATSNTLSPADHKAEWSFITWGLRIEDGIEGIGRTFQHTTTLKPDQQWALGSLLNAVGQDPSVAAGVALPTYQAAKAFSDQLLGVAKDKLLVALIADGQPGPQGQKTSDIKGMFPADDWEVLKRNNERFLAVVSAPAAVVVPGLVPQSLFAAPAQNGTVTAPPAVTPELQGAVANIFSPQPQL